MQHEMPAHRLLETSIFLPCWSASAQLLALPSLQGPISCAAGNSANGPYTLADLFVVSRDLPTR